MKILFIGMSVLLSMTTAYARESYDLIEAAKALRAELMQDANDEIIHLSSDAFKKTVGDDHLNDVSLMKEEIQQKAQKLYETCKPKIYSNSCYDENIKVFEFTPKDVEIEIDQALKTTKDTKLKTRYSDVLERELAIKKAQQRQQRQQQHSYP
jgi:hypothetical protein